jgi:hypothetical protein
MQCAKPEPSHPSPFSARSDQDKDESEHDEGYEASMNSRDQIGKHRGIRRNHRLEMERL